jgi:hypothetical protein
MARFVRREIVDSVWFQVWQQVHPNLAQPDGYMQVRNEIENRVWQQVWRQITALVRQDPIHPIGGA